MAKKTATDALQAQLDALSDRVDQLQTQLDDLIAKAITEDGTVTIQRTCHIVNAKIVSVSAKRKSKTASAQRRLGKMGK